MKNQWKKLLCKLTGHKWQWELGENTTSWIKCTRCKKSMFGEEIGVILINWKKTDDQFNLKDVCWAIFITKERLPNVPDNEQGIKLQ